MHPTMKMAMARSGGILLAALIVTGLWFGFSALLGCGEESPPTEQSDTAAVEPSPEELNQQLVARAQEAVRESGFDPCEEDVVCLVSPHGTIKTVTAQDTWMRISATEPFICPGPRACTISVSYFTGLDSGTPAMVDQPRDTSYKLAPGEFMRMSEDGMAWPPSNATWGVVPTEPQGHCQDPDAVLVRCPENPELDELISAGESPRMLVPCPGLTLVCPHGRNCFVRIHTRGEPDISPPDNLGISFGAYIGTYRIPVLSEDAEAIEVLEVSDDMPGIRARFWDGTIP